MKQIISVVFLLAAAAAFASVKNTMITFSTPGPDKYVDGTTVVDGECYALVWTPNGSEFAGFLANGEAASPSKLVLAAPVAKSGRCPTVVFQLDADYVAANYADGNFEVYLLDTRLTKNGQVTVGLNAAGKPQTIAASAKVGNGVAVKASGAGLTGVAGAVGDAVAAEVPAEANNLTIKSVAIVGGNVQVTAVGTVPYLQYGLSSGSAPDSLADAELKPQVGAASQQEEIVFITEKKGDSQFFRINRK